MLDLSLACCETEMQPQNHECVQFVFLLLLRIEHKCRNISSISCTLDEIAHSCDASESRLMRAHRDSTSQKDRMNDSENAYDRGAITLESEFAECDL